MGWTFPNIPLLPLPSCEWKLSIKLKKTRPNYEMKTMKEHELLHTYLSRSYRVGIWYLNQFFGSKFTNSPLLLPEVRVGLDNVASEADTVKTFDSAMFENIPLCNGTPDPVHRHLCVKLWKLLSRGVTPLLLSSSPSCLEPEFTENEGLRYRHQKHGSHQS